MMYKLNIKYRAVWQRVSGHLSTMRDSSSFGFLGDDDFGVGG